MEIGFTPAARAFVESVGADAITVASLVFSSCCSGPLPPEVKPGAPADAEGFSRHSAEGITLYFDSLLDPRPSLQIDLRTFPLYQELFIQGWE